MNPPAFVTRSRVLSLVFAGAKLAMIGAAVVRVAELVDEYRDLRKPAPAPEPAPVTVLGPITSEDRQHPSNPAWEPIQVLDVGDEADVEDLPSAVVPWDDRPRTPLELIETVDVADEPPAVVVVDEDLVDGPT